MSSDRTKTKRTPIIKFASEIQPTKVHWLWPNRIAQGKLTLIVGDPGLGKSLLTMDMVARLSIGGKWPDGTEIGEPAGSVVLSAEDDPSDTIRPRLDAANADTSRIAIVEAVRVQDEESGGETKRQFSLTQDVETLKQAIGLVPNCKLVTIDPISAYLGKGVDSHNASDVRGLLAPLSELAQSTNVAIVAVSHMNKSQGGSPIYRTMGSLSFTAAARAVWIVAKNPNDPDGPRLFLPVKNNIGKDRTGLDYTIGENSDQAFIEWGGIVTLTADDALNHSGVKPSTKLNEAKDFLIGELSGHPAKSAKVIQELAKQNGIASKTLTRAADQLKVVKSKAGFDDGWTWALKNDAS